MNFVCKVQNKCFLNVSKNNNNFVKKFSEILAKFYEIFGNLPEIFGNPCSVGRFESFESSGLESVFLQPRT